MSGQLLRQTAVCGNYDRLLAYIKDKANPCSVDEFGITALMYAVWNGHVKCVKLLLMNDMGVDSHGNRCSALSIKSTKGYTSLHLAALDCPSWSRKEIIYLLLCMGIDKFVKSNDNQTALDIAIENNNTDFIEIYQKFDNNDSREFRKEIEKTIEDLSAKYSIRNVSNTVDIKNATFPVPDFLLQKERVGAIPSGLAVNEHHIVKLVDVGQKDLHGVDSLRCLQFTSNQASKYRVLFFVHQPHYKGIVFDLYVYCVSGSSAVDFIIFHI